MNFVYRSFDQESLDREYNARATVDDAEVFISAYGQRSAAARNSTPCLPDVPYGDHADEILDLFPAGPGAPVFILAQFVNCMSHLVTAAARQARSLAPGARPTRWNQLR